MISYIKDYAESVAGGITHCQGILNPITIEGYTESIRLIETGEGSRLNCLWDIRSSATCKSLLSYFSDHDLVQTKQWAYVAAKLKIMEMHLEPGGNLESLAWALLSDDVEVIDWWQQHRLYGERPSNPEEIDDFRTDVYLRRQTLRALNGEWNELGPACEQALASPESFNKAKARINQFRFYLALAKGNVGSMHDVLMEMCTPQARRRSFEYESGLTVYFVVMIATMFAKMAWRHGYQLELDTPWIPAEWLPIEPNKFYEDPWPFMKDFDIWQAFPEPYSLYSPRQSIES